jgi:serine protease Do
VALGVIGGMALAIGLNGGTGRGTVAAQVAPADTRPLARTLPGSHSDELLSYAAVAHAASPAIVNIYTARVDRSRASAMEQLMRQFYGQAPQPRVQQSLGSGVIVGADGLIVTNNHVVNGADQILVALADRREFPAKLVFADPRLDLALLRVDTKGAALPTVRIGDSDRTQVGDVVLAIGNPFGVGQTVTHGIISAVARTGIGVSDWQFFLQTDAAINPGNSGGALLDTAGRLVGINTAIFSPSGGSNGIGFAIPANMVRVFLAAADKGKFVAGWIGIEGEPLTAESARAAGLDRPGGLLVTAVEPGGPSAKAGLKEGDIIRTVDGKDVADAGQLRYSLVTEAVGKPLPVVFWRAGREERTTVTLAAPPETPPRQLTQLSGQSILAGVTVANLSPAYAQELGAGLPEKGVVVVKIANGAPAQQLGFLRPGDLIEAVGGQKVGSVADVSAASAKGATSVRFSRAGQRAECGLVAPGQFACRT